MSQVDQHLRRWLDAGILDAVSAEAIRDFERRQPAPEPQRPGVLEALLYLGVVVLSAGGFLLFAQNWDDLDSWARVLAIGVPTVLMFAVGAVLFANMEAPLSSGGQVAWLEVFALFAGLAAVAINEYGLGLGDPGNRGALLTIAAATFLVAVILWVASPSYAQILAMAGATVFLGEAVGNWPDDFSAQLAGMAILAIAAAAIALGELGWMSPLLGVRVLFSGLVIMGPFQAGVNTGPVVFELLAGVAAAAVIAYGVVRASFLVLLVGVGGSFFVLISILFRHFSDRIGAPMAMMISGGIIVAGVLLVALYRRGTTTGATA
jgi:hypothetical protein